MALASFVSPVRFATTLSLAWPLCGEVYYQYLYQQTRLAKSLQAAFKKCGNESAMQGRPMVTVGCFQCVGEWDSSPGYEATKPGCWLAQLTGTLHRRFGLAARSAILCYKSVCRYQARFPEPKSGLPYGVRTCMYVCTVQYVRRTYVRTYIRGPVQH